MQPEISPRCLSCGASYREPAMFCPECGKPLTRPGPVNASTDAEPPISTEGLIRVDASWTGPELSPSRAQPVALPIKPAVEPGNVKAAPLKSENKTGQTSGPGSRSTGPEVSPNEAQPVALPIKPAVEPENVKAVKAAPLNSEKKADQTSEPASGAGAREKNRERLHRASSVASSVARGAFEDNVKRVEKIHHVSTAMLEEATYDPSLRFVLVAVGLFVVFVILLVISKVMG